MTENRLTDHKRFKVDSGKSLFRQFAKYIVINLIILQTISCAGWCGNQIMEQPPRIEWLGNGSIFVQPWHSYDNWLLNPKDQSYTDLPYSIEGKRIGISFSGEKIVVYRDFSDFSYGPVAGPLTEPVKIPVWVTLEPSEDDDKYFFVNIQNSISWVSDQLLLINQKNGATGEIRCGIFDIQKKSWKNFEGDCLFSPGLLMGDVVPGYDGLMAVFAYNEGTQITEFVKKTPKKGFNKVDFPFINLYGGGMNVNFFIENREIYLTTPCKLEMAKQGNSVFPCEGVSYERSKFRLYSWTPEKKEGPRLLRSDLPKRVVFNPRNNKQMAWPEPGFVCVGSSDREGDFIRIPLPNQNK